MTATASVTPPREPGALTTRAPSGDRAVTPTRPRERAAEATFSSPRRRGLGGDVTGREAGPAGREHEAGTILDGHGDRGANGVDLVGDDAHRGLNAVIGEETRGEGTGEILGEAG